MDTITAKELKSLVDKDKNIFILDVREETEFQICRIPNSKLIPLGSLQERVNELKNEDDIVVHCHHGGRSAKAIELLKTKGFTKLRNLTGGIEAWSLDVDESVPRY